MYVPVVNVIPNSVMEFFLVSIQFFYFFFHFFNGNALDNHFIWYNYYECLYELVIVRWVYRMSHSICRINVGLISDSTVRKDCGGGGSLIRKKNKTLWGFVDNHQALTNIE